MRSPRTYSGDFLKGVTTFIGSFLWAFLLGRFGRHHSSDLAGYLAVFILLAMGAWLGWENAVDRAWLRGAFFGIGVCTPLCIFLVLLSHFSNGRQNPWGWLIAGLVPIAATSAAQVASSIRTRHWIAALTTCICAVALIGACLKSFPRLLQRQQAERIIAVKDEPLPPLHLTDLRGKAIPESELSGHITVINFWGTWCANCIEELPDLQAVAHDYAADSRVKFLLINSEISGDNSSKISRFVDHRHISLPIALDPSQSFYRLGLSELPQTLIADRNAHIRFIDSGSDPATMHQHLHSQIDSLLASN